ncbi:hypothetical protein IPM19_02700 [bacterium]|nr:MAG: hypothetical protein IPM19_02700 [bacterium]
MLLFLKKCTNCGTTKQDPKMNTTMCPECGRNREFMPAERAADNGPAPKVHAEATSPNLEELRKKYLGNRRPATPAPAQPAPAHDIVIMVEHPVIGKKAVILDQQGTIIGEQG